MPLYRRKGFTLIELLVVIAIIGILAAMLFPVFARARESARKVQCLSNVKNIALAFQMYLADYDRFPPTEHRQEVVNYFNFGCAEAARLAAANPYLETPVILDEYIKNREVWKCPSARTSTTFEIMDPYLNSKGTDDWFLRFQEAKSGCPQFKSCHNVFPSGWGGNITDSQVQRVWCTPSPGMGAFEQSIGTAFARDESTSEMNDPSKRVVCADAGIDWVDDFTDTMSIAYPDTCRVRSISCSSGCGGDWVNCSQSRSCSPPKNTVDPTAYKWATDVSTRKANCPTRHMGGENIGFADGHAAWFPAEEILFGGSPAAPQGTSLGKGYGTGEFEGVQTCIDPNKDL